MGRQIKDNGGGDFKKLDPGTHAAVCNMVVLLDQQRTEWQGQEKIVDQVYIRWEVPSERVEYEVDGVKKEGPMTIGKTYTSSLSERANLRKDLTNWRGREFTDEELQGFDIEGILGKPCQISVTHRESNGKTYQNVTAVVAWPKGIAAIQAENELIYFDAEQPKSLEKLPKWLRDKIGATGLNGHSTDDEFDDDIPF